MGTGHHHHHHHGHHHHGHHHHHNGEESGALGRIGLAFGLNLVFAIIELVGGFWANSMAILTDALHDFGDAIAIGLAFFLERLSRKAADAKYSYGYRRFSTAAALTTGFILVAGAIFILSQAIPRLFAPQTPNAEGMLALAILGVAVNGFAAWRVSRGHSLNERMIVWHLIEDVVGWVAVLVGAVLIQVTGWGQVDAILACLLSFWILYNVSRNLKEVLGIFLQMVPPGIDLSAIEKKVKSFPNVVDLHHIHVWSIDGEKHVLTAHVVVSGTWEQSVELKKEIRHALQHMGISEATLEFEQKGAPCDDPHHH